MFNKNKGNKGSLPPSGKKGTEKLIVPSPTKVIPEQKGKLKPPKK